MVHIIPVNFLEYRDDLCKRNVSKFITVKFKILLASLFHIYNVHVCGSHRFSVLHLSKIFFVRNNVRMFQFADNTCYWLSGSATFAECTGCCMVCRTAFWGGVRQCRRTWWHNWQLLRVDWQQESRRHQCQRLLPAWVTLHSKTRLVTVTVDSRTSSVLLPLTLDLTTSSCNWTKYFYNGSLLT